MSGTLVSPGVRVTIVDESFYAGAGPGTIPLVVFATANNKPAPSGTGIAPGTVSGAAGQLYLAISQRDAITQFGTPEFTMYQGTAVQGDELNEYGLHAAYSYLGISNRCYMLRAAIDLAQLAPSTSPPQGPPLPGTYWLNISTSKWGLFQSLGLDIAGSTWVPVTVLIPTLAQINPNTDIPLPTFGVNGNFAVVPC